MKYNFILKLSIGEMLDPEQYLNVLYDAGCDDATLSVHEDESLALNFTRESDSSENAILSAIADVKKAIPNAKLIEVIPSVELNTGTQFVIGSFDEFYENKFANSLKDDLVSTSPNSNKTTLFDKSDGIKIKVKSWKNSANIKS
jgi:hypothetical protein